MIKQHLQIVGLAAVSALALAGAVQAAPHGQSDFIRDYDSNKDGTVTSAEFEAVRTARLKAMDLDGDGRVSEAEYIGEYATRLDAKLAASTASAEEKAATREGQLKQAKVRYDVLDGDKNGDLTAAEFAASGKRAFAEQDGDGDGVVKAGEPKRVTKPTAP
ncbi:hypothetical protein [Caulobacter mirabilis]|uniref:EF-hand domain-containing protein n=1 Tax=Caulobacter mirabilis TaxID=69666 RepID=A0A2D2B3H0_9CAUL|nr:hypothetical protein [Caulobacter mirabilis]ATQ44746.1 hypothetical protein CSW64_21320 [Caulobacter mirabilis]